MQTITLDGFEVSLFRNSSGVLTIDVDSANCQEADTQDEGCPKFEMNINEGEYRPHPSGTGWQLHLLGVGWEDC